MDEKERAILELQRKVDRHLLQGNPYVTGNCGLYWRFAEPAIQDDQYA